jgi:hypothetical protein
MLDLSAPELPGQVARVMLPSQDRRGRWYDPVDPKNLWTPTTALPGHWSKVSRNGSPAIAVDGMSSGYLTCSNSVSLGTVYSGSAWVNIQDASVSNMIAAPASGTTYLMYLTAAGVFAHNTGDLVSVTITVPYGRWMHLGVVHNGTKLRFFQNGKQVEGEKTSSTNNTADLKYIGTWSFLSLVTKGAIESVRFWNRALSNDEMAWLAGENQPRMMWSPSVLQGLRSLSLLGVGI